MDKNTLPRPFMKRYVVYNVIFISNVRDPYLLLIRRGCKFHNNYFNSTLNFVLKEREGEVISSITSQAEVITPDQMEYLWQRGFLGSDTPKLLRNTTLFVFGNCFALHCEQSKKTET